MNIYKIEFDFNYLNIDPLKEKEFNVLIGYMTGSRFGQLMSYSCPCSITFDKDDHKHKYPTITEMESFKRKVTNCICFNLNKNYMNRGYFNKLFIYYDGGKKVSSYGIVFYNTETGKTIHRYLIYGDVNDLFRVLNECFNYFHQKKLYDFYEKRYNSIKNRNSLTFKDCPRESELKQILEELI